MATQDEATLQAFTTWLKSAPPGGNVGAMLQGYRRQLLTAGTSEAEADSRMAAIQRLMKDSSEVWPLLFDNIYASDAPTFRTAPNAWLEAAVRGRPPGQALDVCMGEGRNAVYLAQQGWDVTGFDVSAKGLERARERAAQAGVAVNTVRETNDSFDYGASRWDLIAIFYAPIPVTDAGYVRRLERALKPGGLVVVESFSAPQDAVSRRPVHIDPDELKRAFAAFGILHFEDVSGVPDWDQQQGRVVRLVAEKPS